MCVYIFAITHILLFTSYLNLSLCVFDHLPRYGGISVGGVNSQVRLSEAAIRASFRDLKGLFNSSRVCYSFIWNICWNLHVKCVDTKALFECSVKTTSRVLVNKYVCSFLGSMWSWFVWKHKKMLLRLPFQKQTHIIFQMKIKQKLFPFRLRFLCRVGGIWQWRLVRSVAL